MQLSKQLDFNLLDNFTANKVKTTANIQAKKCAYRSDIKMLLNETNMKHLTLVETVELSQIHRQIPQDYLYQRLYEQSSVGQEFPIEETEQFLLNSQLENKASISKSQQILSPLQSRVRPESAVSQYRDGMFVKSNGVLDLGDRRQRAKANKSPRIVSAMTVKGK
ncbi:Hypothetical_protein [Hexamita inflata]|uniref:Hypothetical_protein n=1 Tax=Hexamita inflata TaxID=28002 RepID=A0AA86NZJ0_9EUKA|nr:Hypothetical protein HINF_LOCUS17232 [Hexamita inflata]